MPASVGLRCAHVNGILGGADRQHCLIRYSSHVFALIPLLWLALHCRLAL